MISTSSYRYKNIHLTVLRFTMLNYTSSRPAATEATGHFINIDCCSARVLQCHVNGTSLSHVG